MRTTISTAFSIPLLLIPTVIVPLCSIQNGVSSYYCCCYGFGFQSISRTNNNHMFIRRTSGSDRGSSNISSTSESNNRRKRHTFIGVKNTKTAIVDLQEETVLEEDATSTPSSSITSSSSAAAISSFTTEPMSLYIEDTDAYGVMFNGNYIKFYERAIQQEVFPLVRFNNDESGNKKYNNSNTNNVSVMVITHVRSHKFKSSPTLGNEFIIQGERIADENKEEQQQQQQQWSVKMIKYDSNKDDNSTNDSDGKEIVYNSAILTLTEFEYNTNSNTKANASESSPTSSSSSPSPSPLAPSRAKTKNSNVKTIQRSFRTYRDEYIIPMIMTKDQHYNLNHAYNNSLQGNNIKCHLPFHSILKYFERLRTIFIGGPNVLNKLQNEDGILFVVTSIDDLGLVPNTKDVGDNDYPYNHDVTICQDVIVQSEYVVKRGGMIIECHQQLLGSRNMNYDNCKDMGDDDGGHQQQYEHFVIAKGVITLCAVDTKNGYRPTKNIPQYVRQLWN